jgi:hypothetical protein
MSAVPAIVLHVYNKLPMTIFENNFDYKKIIVIALVFVIIAEGFFIFFWKLSHNSTEDTNQAQPSNQLNSGRTIFECDQLSEPDRDFCYKDAGFGINVNGGDLLLCGKISDSMIKIFCFKTMALQKKDVSICDLINIIQSEGKVVNIDLVLKNECYQSVAIALRDNSVCNKIASVQYQYLPVGIGFGTISSTHWDYSEKSCVNAVTNFKCQTPSQPDSGWCPSGKVEMPNKDAYGCPSVPTCQ